MTRRRPPHRVARMRFSLLLMTLDMVAIVLAFALAGWAVPNAPPERATIVIVTLLPLYLLAAFGTHSYDIDLLDRPATALARAMKAFVFAAGAVLFVAFYLRASAEFSRALFITGSIGAALLILIARIACIRAAPAILGGEPFYTILIAQDPAMPLGAAFSRVIPADRFHPEHHDPAMYDRLAVSLHGADRVVVCCAAAQREAWVHFLQGANVRAELFVPELDSLGALGVGRVAGGTTLVVAEGPLNLPDRIAKRLFDVLLAGPVLLFLAPMMALVALAIKLDSPGPVFFVQTRIGRGNRMFRMLKFRSMHSALNDSAGTDSTRRGDARVTRIGQWIRSTSIDELPQLMNVLAGTMSIVGPRPHALGSRAENQLFWEIDGRYWHRHSVKPGLTGLAQVRGYRGATNHRSDLLNRLQSDLEYLNGWTIWRDVVILFRTFGVVVHHNAF
ncbi:exopolysaccharide biosynthesis polyprenyl glycosylphosphotransferase [Sphingomonas silueang]|uniref:exopolysaccharide biosynthesis polyprenyl glycosylphosphotransferase n=1 Tax=Sphingomonas silueang TaxID=3156617 RepID=UPI0032B5D192